MEKRVMGVCGLMLAVCCFRVCPPKGSKREPRSFSRYTKMKPVGFKLVRKIMKPFGIRKTYKKNDKLVYLSKPDPRQMPDTFRHVHVCFWKLGYGPSNQSHLAPPVAKWQLVRDQFLCQCCAPFFFGSIQKCATSKLGIPIDTLKKCSDPAWKSSEKVAVFHITWGSKLLWDNGFHMEHTRFVHLVTEDP